MDLLQMIMETTGSESEGTLSSSSITIDYVVIRRVRDTVPKIIVFDNTKRRLEAAQSIWKKTDPEPKL